MADGPETEAALSYAGYLKLPELLSCQAPRSTAHDELLFIVIHQTSELWMKLALHELGAARERILGEDLAPALKMLSRVARIQAHLVQAWEILATLTPVEYGRIREGLGSSSGFQSVQNRLLELRLGARSPQVLAAAAGDGEGADELRAEAARPSLHLAALTLLARRGLTVPAERLSADPALPTPPSPAVEAAWAEVYRRSETLWDLYDLAEKLVDLDYRAQLWRAAHLKTVGRLIGAKPGTGGSAGLAYLARGVDQVFFPELWSVRSAL